MSQHTHIDDAKVIGFPSERKARVGVLRGEIHPDNDNTLLVLPPRPEARWPVWKSMTFILVSCGLFWAAIIFGLVQIF